MPRFPASQVRWWLVFCFALFARTAVGQIGSAEPRHITIGDTKAAVLEQLGWPTGTALANNREVLTYPEGEVVLVDGKVVQVRAATNAPGKPQFRPRPKLLAPPPALNPALAPPSAQPIPRPRPQLTPAPQPAPPRPPTPPQQPAPQPPSLLSILLQWPLILLVIAAAALPFLKAAKRAAAHQRRKLGQDLDRYAPSPRIVATRRPPTTAGAPPPLPSRPTGPPSLPPSPFAGPLTFELIDALEWRRFEELAATYLRQEGYRAEGTKFGGDGGIDLVLYRDPKPEPYAYVQCKAHSGQVKVESIRAFFGVMAADKVERGYFISSNGFTKPALDFARGKSLTLIIGQQLLDSLNYLPAETLAALRRKVWRDDYHTPTCPRCGIKMIRRESETPFWGCSRYPACDHKIPMRAAER